VKMEDKTSRLMQVQRPFYLGTHTVALDGKGRITMPSEWRRTDYETHLVLLRAKNCLRGYPASWFADKLREISQLPATDPTAVRFRAVAAEGKQVTWDAQGRVVLPEEMRSKAGLKREVKMLGRADYFEIWDAKHLGDMTREEITVEDAGL